MKRMTNHVAIGVGLLEEDQTLPIGVGRYIVNMEEPGSAEIALTVSEMYRGICVGTLMFKHLREIATAHSVEKFPTCLPATYHALSVCLGPESLLLI